MRKGIITVLLLLLSTNLVNAAVWENENQWSQEWENRYQQWVQTYWNADFFSDRTLADGRRNPYYGLRNDCADTVYSMRLIFAYENKLPFKMQDPTSSSYRTISNSMSRWDGFSNDLTRFKKFWLYLTKDVGSTKSLPNDSYPVAISRSTIKPGTFLLASPDQKHSWTLRQMLDTGIPDFVYNSTVGLTSGAQLKQRRSWPNPGWMFEGAIKNGYPSSSSHVGFRAFRWPEYIGKPVWEVPGYSTEQYKIKASGWTSYIKNKLRTREERTEDRLVRLMDNVCMGLQERMRAVKEAVKYVNLVDQRCLTKQETYTYSTPSRDKRLFDSMMELRNAYKSARNSNLPTMLRKRLQKIYPHISSSASYEARNMRYSGRNEYSFCNVQYLRDRIIDMAEAKRRMFMGKFNGNPNEPSVVRWGEEWSSWRTDMCDNHGEVWRPSL